MIDYSAASDPSCFCTACVHVLPWYPVRHACEKVAVVPTKAPYDPRDLCRGKVRNSCTITRGELLYSWLYRGNMERDIVTLQ